MLRILLQNPPNHDFRRRKPQDLLDFAGITEQAAFVGMGPKFQIWEPSRLEARKKQARDSVAKQKMTLPNPRSKGGE